MNKNVRDFLDVVFYVIVFFLIQLFFIYFIQFVAAYIEGKTIHDALQCLQQEPRLTGKMMAAVSVLCGMSSICWFIWRKWTPVSRTWIAGRPWFVLLWVAAAALGSILPSEWVIEQIQYTMPKAMEQLFEDIMREPLGYVAIGIVSAVAEEVVFRGAVLRRLLDMSDERWHWAAIIASALIFGGVHGNVPQFIHAALMGLILGWMYYRTRSIIPGIVFHCVNNTVAYVMFNLLPQMNDGKLIDLFHGNERLMWMGLLCSMLIFLPALLQLNLRLKRAE